MRFDKRLFLYASVSSLSTFGMSGAALAQAGADEIVEVVGIRAALDQALDIKRESNSIVDAISAEDIGKFPDKNIAESLQRVAGVTINRGFAGEGNEVSIRGVNPELTQVQLNGQFVASTTWFSLAFNRRSFNMDLMPSEMVAGVEVYKSSEAKIDEGGLGGTVILKTRKPLDLDPLTVFASAEYQDLDIADDNGTALNGLVSWKNDAETFGVLFAASVSETVGRGSKAENYWEEGWSAAGISEFRQDRERTTFDITAQFAPSDNLTFTFHHFNTELDATNTNQNFLLFGGSNCDQDNNTATPAVPCAVAMSAGPVGGTTGLGLPMQGTITGPGGQITSSGSPANGWMMAQDINSRTPELTTEVTELTVDYEADGWSVTGIVGTTEAEGGNGGNVNSLWGIPGDDPRWLDNGGNLTVGIDMTLDVGMQVQVNGLDPADGSWQALLGGPSIAETTLTDEETYAQADFSFDVEWGAINSVDAGIKLRTHEFGRSIIDRTIDTSFIGSSNLDAFQSGAIEMSSDVMVNGSNRRVAQMGDNFDSLVRANVSTENINHPGFGEVEEDITSLYVQFNFEGDGYRGNFGVRQAQTDVTGVTRVANVASQPYGDFTVSTTEADYSNTLPSFNIAVDLADDVIFRGSVSEVMSRPSYGNLNPSVAGINPSNRTASRGNIGLDPFEATNFDAGVEWYFAEEALISAGWFLKDIDAFITSGTIVEQLPDQNNGNILAPFTVTVPIQGAGGEVRGFEFQYQQAFDSGFGIVSNITIAQSEGYTETFDANGVLIDTTKTDLPGASDVSYNITGYYENDLFAARLAYTYRDEFLAEGTAISGSLDNFDEQAFLDGSFTWHVTDQVDVSVEMINMLNEVSVQNHSGGLRSNRVTTDNGRRTYLKASFRM